VKREPLVIAFVVLCSSSWSAWSQESKPGESRPASYDLRISGAARAVIVEVSGSAKGKMSVKRGATEIVQTVDSKGRARWLDEVADTSAKKLVDRRTFLEAQVTDQGLIKDPGYEGLTIVFTTEEGKTNVATEGGRRILAEDLLGFRQQAGATALWAKLPENIEIGAKFPFEGRSFIATLMNADGEIKEVEGQLALDRVDSSQNRAYVSGSVGFKEEVNKQGARFVATYKGALLKLEIDLTNHELVQVVFMGTAKLSGLGELEGAVRGEVDVDTKASTKKTEGVASLKNRKPSFRENTHVFSGVEFKLPSCWLSLPNDKPGITSLVDSRVEKDLVIEVARISDKSDPSSEEFIKAFTEALRKEEPKAKVQKAQFPIGKGITFESAAKDSGGLVRGCVVPVGDELARARIVGPPDAVKKGESDFKVLTNSLKKAKP
jgi:hypothetical protein